MDANSDFGILKKQSPISFGFDFASYEGFTTPDFARRNDFAFYGGVRSLMVCSGVYIGTWRAEHVFPPDLKFK